MVPLVDFIPFEHTLADPNSRNHNPPKMQSRSHKKKSAPPVTDKLLPEQMPHLSSSLMSRQLTVELPALIGGINRSG